MSKINWERISNKKKEFGGGRYDFEESWLIKNSDRLYVSKTVLGIRKKKIPNMRPCQIPSCTSFVRLPNRKCRRHGDGAITRH